MTTAVIDSHKWKYDPGRNAKTTAHGALNIFKLVGGLEYFLFFHI